METTPLSEVFGFLEKNAPAWLESLRDIARVQLNLSEIQPSRIPPGGAGSLSPVCSQSRSSEAVRLENESREKAAVMVHETPLPQQQQVQCVEQGSLASDDPSFKHAQNRYRARNSIQVEFDGGAQLLLQEVVDGIADAMDLIRRARRGVGVTLVGAPSSAQWQSAWMKSFSKASPSNSNSPVSSPPNDKGETTNGKSDDKEGEGDDEKSDDDDDDDDDDDLFHKNALLANIRMRPGRKNAAPVDRKPSAESRRIMYLDNADDRLEKARDKCYEGAYQLLRDGNCGSEAGNAIEQLEQVLAQINEARERSNGEE